MTDVARAIAQHNLRQVEAWRPATEAERQLRALNLRQLQAYLKSGHPASVRSAP